MAKGNPWRSSCWRPRGSFYYSIWGLALGLVAALFRMRVEGQENVPLRSGLVLASNHASYVDPILIGVAAKRELCYVTKAEVFPIPVLGWLIRKLNAHPIDRSRGDRGALRVFEQILRSGKALFLSPEGTRNKSGEFLKPKAGIGLLVHRTAATVVPVYVYGTAKVWRSLLGLDRIVIRFGRPMQFSPEADAADRRVSYQQISVAVMNEIAKLRRGCRNAGPAVA